MASDTSPTRDFRGGGDQHQVTSTSPAQGKDSEKADSWNLMSSFWPRTRTVSIDSMAVYKTALADALATTTSSTAPSDSADTTTANSEAARIAAANATASTALLTQTATQIIRAMNEVLRLPPRLPPHLRESVYEWLSLMVGWRDDDEGDGEGRRVVMEEMKRCLEGKVGRGML